ncbi:MAG: nitrogen fixation protein NifH, partial [Dehalococcoidia bacterium]|nr:nitrogen fixation protein NifH [Dehalococcoidia bacterium]
MSDWIERLNGDPVPWLLEDDNPAVKHLALRWLLDRPADDAEVVQARAATMEIGPIVAILRAQHPDRYWVKPGPGYATKYNGTVWQVIFLDQMGVDGRD